MTKEMKINKLSYINNAIDTWEKMKKGIYFSWEKNRYTSEYCDTQIAYFEEMKNETINIKTK